MDTNQEIVVYKICNVCSDTNNINMFIKNRNICKTCNNLKRRKLYNEDEQHRKKAIHNATVFKSKKAKERRANQLLEQEYIGLNNKQCRYCDIIKDKSRFRVNRLKCIDCERDEPKEKFKRYVRTRIYNCLLKRKSRSSIEYLGCSTDDYISWIMNYNSVYNLDNYGKVWHIDHVIPISKFNLDNLDEQLLAFNWRNTMPLSCQENLKKGNKIIKVQVSEHFKKIKKYHIDNNINLPKIYTDLFATHLVVLETPESLNYHPVMETL